MISNRFPSLNLGRPNSIFFILFVLFLAFNIKGQVIIPPSNPSDSSIRFPISSWYDFNRSQIIFKANELSSISNQRLVSIGFYLQSSGSGCKASKVTVRLKKTADSIVTTGIYDTTGAQLVYAGVVPANSFLTDSVWISLPFQIPFDYSGIQNLMVLIESDKTSEGNDPSNNSKQYRLSQTSGKRFQAWWGDNIAPQGNGVIFSQRPNVKFESTVIPPNCTGSPSSGTASINPSILNCTGQQVQLSLSGYSTNNGIQLQWQRKPSSGTAWEDIAGATLSDFSLPVFGSFVYRCKVRCSFSGQISFSNEVSSSLNFTEQSVPFSQGFIGLVSSEGQNSPFSCQYFQTTVNGNNPWKGTLGKNTSNNARGLVGRTDSAALYSGWSTDAYLFMPALNMSTDSLYKFRFFYKHSRPGDNNEGPSFEVRIGSMPEPAFQTTTLAVRNNQNDTAYKAIEVVYNPPLAGKYFFSIRNRTLTSNPFYLVIDDLSVSKEIIVSSSAKNEKEYPNIQQHGQNALTLDLPSAYENSEILIYDLTGKIIYVKKDASGKIEISGLKDKGVYCITVNKNDTKWQKKVILGL